MFGHSWVILLVILILVLIVVGPGKLGKLGGALGEALREFRKTQADDKAGKSGPPPSTSS